MKHICFLFLSLLTWQSLSATHIIGGSISYRHLGSSFYEIRLEVLRDCATGSSLAPFDDPASVGIWTDNGIFIGQLLIPFTGSDTLSIETTSSSCILTGSVCVEKAIYIDTVSGPADAFTVAYQRCCRSQLLLNLLEPLATGMTFHTHIDPVYENSSPVFNKDFPKAIFVNTPFVYDASAADADGDSLSYELIAPFAGATAANPQPQPPLPPPYEHAIFRPPYSVDNMLGGNYSLTLDSVSGEMVAIPQTIGTFQIAYAIHEYRNGELINTSFREFAFVVTPAIPGGIFTLNGAVYVNDSIPLDKGYTQLLEFDLAGDSLVLYEEQELGPNATYLFTDLPSGVFYIKAVVDTASIYFDQYVPTYYNASAFWYDAVPLNQCDSVVDYRDIYLLHVDSLIGFIEMEGVVTRGHRTHEPVPELNLVLADEDGMLIQARTTNMDGYFKFENLTPGNYLLYADLINSNIDNSKAPLISLHSNTTVQVYLYFDSLALQTPVSTRPDLPINEYSIIIYPNPASDDIIINVNGENNHRLLCELLDLSGKVIDIREIEVNKNEIISITGLDLGIYLVRVKDERGTGIRKFVKGRR